MQDEIPEADVVSDDGGSGDGGDVCEVISPFSFFLLLSLLKHRNLDSLREDDLKTLVVLSIDGSFCTGSHV